MAKTLLETSEPVQADVLTNPLVRIDTVVMNPPFGTQKRGTDKAFLVEALRLAKEAVYSIHISSSETVKLFRDLAKSYGFQAEVLPVRYRMRREYWWHKKKVHEMPVDVYKFVKVG
jgi:putative methylase